MDFTFSAEQQAIRDAVAKICARFDLDYWLEERPRRRFPARLPPRSRATAGSASRCRRQYGGAGLGITEAAMMMQTIAESGAGMSGASAVHMNIFSLNPVRRVRQRRAEGALAAAAHPGPGPRVLRRDRARHRAQHDAAQDAGGARGRPLSCSGRKIWTSTAQVANKILLLARTAPLDEARSRTRGLTLFYTDLDRAPVEVREIEKMGRKAVDSNLLFIDELRVPVADRVGEEGRGFEYILHGFNPERILIAAEGGRARPRGARTRRGVREERIVFDRPIGENQAIQHPLARCWMELEAANLMAFKAAALYDAGKPCGVEANAAKYLAGEACFRACETAVMAHGGMGYAKEYHVERFLREVADPAHRAGEPRAHALLHRREGARPAQVLLAAVLVVDRSIGRRPRALGVGRGFPCARGCVEAELRRASSGRYLATTDRSSCAIALSGRPVPDLVHAEQGNAEIAAQRQLLAVPAHRHHARCRSCRRADRRCCRPRSSGRCASCRGRAACRGSAGSCDRPCIWCSAGSPPRPAAGTSWRWPLRTRRHARRRGTIPPTSLFDLLSTARLPWAPPRGSRKGARRRRPQGQQVAFAITPVPLIPIPVEKPLTRNLTPIHSTIWPFQEAMARPSSPLKRRRPACAVHALMRHPIAGTHSLFVWYSV